jgi:hypothetical protein
MTNKTQQSAQSLPKAFTPQQNVELKKMVFNLLNRWGGNGMAEFLETMYTLALSSPDIELEASNLLEFYETKKDLQNFLTTLHNQFYLPPLPVSIPSLPTKNS